MAKNKDINISPSKGISIVIKNDIVQPQPIKPIKPKRKEDIKELMYYQTHQPQQLFNNPQVIQVILKHNQGDFLYGVILLLLHQF